jgi:hypothetical protein
MTGGNHYVQVCVECRREWKPKCRCGSSTYSYENREVERDAA